jgi:hypothetical protein
MCDLTWRCLNCGEPVLDGTGYLHVNHTEIDSVRAAHDAFDKRTHGVIAGKDWDDWFALPDHAPWGIHHASCDPRPESNDYWVAIERVRTQAAMLTWTAHLMEKNWIGYTNWIELIRSQVGAHL